MSFQTSAAQGGRSAPTGVAAPKANISGYNTRNVPNFTPQQMQLFQQLLGPLLSGGGVGKGIDWLSKLASGDEEMFDELEAPAYSSYNKAIGQLGSRFAGFGSGALDSSAFQNATSGAARELGENLQSKRLGLQSGAVERLLGLSQDLLHEKPYDTFLEKKKSGWDTAGDIGSVLLKLLPLLL